MAAWVMRIAAITAAAGLLTACAGPTSQEPPNPYLTAAIGQNGPGTAPGPGIFALVPATHAHVQLQCPVISAVHYDAESIPLEAIDGVYSCTTAPYLDAPDGTPQIEEFVDRVAADDIPALLDAYAVPDEARSTAGCDAQLLDPLIVWLHYGDEQITPVYAPQDECGFPQPEAAAVYGGLELHRLLVAREKTKP